MTPTERLYYADPLLLDFSADICAHGTWNGAPSVILDRTAFYPESGGQMADRGTLGGVAVIDVQVDEAGVVHHILEGGALPAVGASTAGVGSTWRFTQAITCCRARSRTSPPRPRSPRAWASRAAPSTSIARSSTSARSPRRRRLSTASSTMTSLSALSSPPRRSSSAS